MITPSTTDMHSAGMAQAGEKRLAADHPKARTDSFACGVG
jgi:hypothetical protein